MVQIENIETERIEKIGKPIVFGIKHCKTFRKALETLIGQNRKRNNTELRIYTEGLLNIYNRFHPELKATVHLHGWKGKSGLKITEFPDHFLVKEWRKLEKDEEPKEITHKIDKSGVNLIFNVLESIKVGKRYKTSKFAKKWALINKIYKNADNKKIFDENGFNFSNISGCRKTYFYFYYPLKICEYYGLIKYEKSGYITKLTNTLVIQSEFL